jgi:hypothetical protein
MSLASIAVAEFQPASVPIPVHSGQSPMEDQFSACCQQLRRK